MPTDFQAVTTLSGSVNQNQDANNEKPRENSAGDLPSAIGALPLHLTGARVDDNPIDFFPVAIGAHPHRKQDVFESDVGILGRG